jgi:two-component system NtrC family sensor kinase
MTATLDDEVVDLRRANAELQRRLNEALAEREQSEAQKAAMAEIVEAINTSPGDLAPVFDTMLERATVLCEASFGILMTYDGRLFQTVALRGVPAAYAEFLRKPIHPAPQNGLGRLLSGERLVHIADIRADEAYRTGDPLRVATADLGGSRTHLVVPLLKQDMLLGAIVAYRQEVRPFTDKQIALLENFAAQAVIAMENARLITETREALEQQTATAEVLQVINSSPGDLSPVFDAMLEKAMRLCEAAYGTFVRFDGENVHVVALRDVPAALADFLRVPSRVRPGTAADRLNRGERYIHVPDVSVEPESISPRGRALVELGGARSILVVPLRKAGTFLGAIVAYRQEVRPFTEKQIALLESFAVQAVIAMENARLITETREALEQQTATAEVLQVINSSPGNLPPVFDAMLEKAMYLCEAAFGALWTYDGEHLHAVAMHGVPSAFADFAREPLRPGMKTGLGRVLRGERLIHIADIRAGAIYQSGDRLRVATVELAGARTLLLVPLRKDDVLLGIFSIYRQEVRPFTDKQIALLQNFAAQAVIAMENARLITETREALEQQTATAEVLGVINASPGDLAPVFGAILEKAHALCGAATGSLQLYDGEFIRAVATRGLPDEFANILRQPRRSGFRDAFLRDAPFVQITDLADPVLTGGDKALVAAHDITGVRTHLRVPLRKDDAFLGFIVAGRREVRPFSQQEISLLQSFAAQAVIAIDNARLLNEIRQRQAELRVTFDNMADGVVMFDETLHLAAWNRNFQQILDLPDALLTERPSYADYLRILAERGEFGTENIEAELNRRLENTTEEFRAERTRPDGRVIEVRRNAVPGGGFVLIYSDITERKRSEAEIRAARDAAEAAYRDLKAAQASLIQAEKMASLGQLTAGIAHEIKNPLNFVNNFAGLSVELLDELKETAAPAITALGDDKRAEIGETIEMLTGNLEKIAEHGRRADGIVKSMLEHSRGTSGERRSVDLNGLIEEALNLAYHGARAQDASFNITLERDFAGAIAPIELVPQDITRVCLNLFSNGFYAATKRQKQGGDSKFKPTLKVSTRDLGDAVEINIRDNGVGIPPEIKDKLFQPFFTTKPTGEGTGLGLSISYDIVTQEHGGTITADSQIGEFTEFTVRLPRVYGATIAEAAS